MNAERRRAVVGPTASLREVMKTIDEAALGIALVTDEADRLLGVVTDGDVRRSVLAGKDLERPATDIMNINPTTVSPDTDMQEIRRLFIQTVLKQLPVVDADGKLVDVVTVSDLLTLPLSTPDITEREIHAVLAVMRSGDLSLGPKVVEFETKIAAYSRRKYAVAVNSGTSGLHLIIRALGIGEDDEVITTPFSFIASSNCILYERARPVFVDINPDTYNIDTKLIEAAVTSRTKAILAVDVFGQPARYDQLEKLASAHGLALISDSCESIGADFMGRRASTYGVAGVFGFYPNKQLTTGEGGVIVTDDVGLADLCYSMRNQGRGQGNSWLVHERLGYNYRLSDLSCAIGIEQLVRLDEMLERRAETARQYSILLEGTPGLVLPYIDPAITRMSWFVYVVRLDDDYSRADRDMVIQLLRRKGIGVANYFPPIHLQPLYREMFGLGGGAFPVTERISERTLALPFHSSMSDVDCEFVAKCLREALSEIR